MAALLHPGVYVMEIPSGVRSIEGAPTSTTIFVGEAERGPVGPTKIKSVIEFERLFGGYRRALDQNTSNPPSSPTARTMMRLAVDGFFQNGGSTAYILRAMDGWSSTNPDSVGAASRELLDSLGNAVADALIASSPGFWGNGVRVFVLESSDGDNTRFRLLVCYRRPDTNVDDIEVWDRLSPAADDENYVVDTLKRSLYVQWGDPDVVAPFLPRADLTNAELADMLDGVSNASEPVYDNLRDFAINHSLIGNAQQMQGGTGGGAFPNSLPAQYQELLSAQLASVDDAALLVAAPEALLEASNEDGYLALMNVFVAFVEARPRLDIFFVGDLPAQRGDPPTQAVTDTVARINGLGVIINASNFAGVYWPHVVVPDPIGVGKNPSIRVPPAGYVAGLFARIDGRRGVWKAPAGTEATLGGVLALEHSLNDGHSDELNPKGVNALRQIPGAGRVVWGARTLIPSSEWRYVPVRRTAIFLRTSIYNGIQWAVFEPNDEPLWSSLRATIGGFMETQFRNGAFAGATSSEAYFVKVDSETTTEIDKAGGVVNILVGFAPLRPAEFVVVKLSQKTSLTA